jgi:calcium-dependent protein kinase
MYQLDSLIGKGSFSEVYKASFNGQSFAVKKTNYKRLNKKLLRNLYLEIHILRTYSHKNIVKLHDVYVKNDHLMLVMDLCPLGDLHNWMLTIKSLNIPLLSHSNGLNYIATKHLLRQIADALAFLHSRNIIHRDLKPQVYF